MAVRMFFVGGRIGNAHADDRHDIRGGVGERVKTVGEDGDCASGETERDLGAGYCEIEDEDVVKD
jgi:hypothetical protein